MRSSLGALRACERRPCGQGDGKPRQRGAARGRRDRAAMTWQHSFRNESPPARPSRAEAGGNGPCCEPRRQAVRRRRGQQCKGTTPAAASSGALLASPRRRGSLQQRVEREIEALEQRGFGAKAAALVLRQLAVDREHRIDDVARAERGQHRLQRVVDRQQVAGAASGGQREHRLAAQRIGRQRVEKHLQQAAVGRLVDRRGNQHALRPRECAVRLRDPRVRDVAVDQRLRPATRAPRSHRGARRARRRARARAATAMTSATDATDSQRC